MTEGTWRKPHTRRYIKPIENSEPARVVVPVDDRGIVEISEELLDLLLRGHGYTEETTEEA